MLAAALIVAGLFASSKPVVPVTAACPASPEATFVAAARACPALEISGSVDARGVTLDPVYDVSAMPADFTRPAEGAVVTGYAADGRRLFAFPVGANGAFHAFVPLALPAQQILARVVLANGDTRSERVAVAHGEPEAEIVALDDGRAIVAWNAHAFPAIRVRESPDRAPIAAGAGTSTFEQMSVDTRVSRIYVEFSDGVRSVSRTYTIFGRR